ncbi:MAG: hypothetical protein INQ03_25720 [Candidatus Heimdallarchaeota archaeon]|nr:hypothetical protein [Candidatus Heimdallarchaeota archaeon]
MTRISLIPTNKIKVANYWCTWALQNYIHGQNDPNLLVSDLEGAHGAILARNNLNEKLLFSEDGWLNQQFGDIKSEIFLVLDDGWDLPLVKGFYSTLLHLSAFDLHRDRFSYTGSPEQKLKALNDQVRSFGWRGVGLWVAAQPALKYLGNPLKLISYWKKRIIWSRYAGVGYWKVDWGIWDHSMSFRHKLIKLKNKYYPELIIEHAWTYGPFNTMKGRIEEKFVNQVIELLRFSDVVRLYDTSPQLEIASMLERASQVLYKGCTDIHCKGIINVEDMPYLAAGLGCAIGIMRHSYIGLRCMDGKDIDFSMFNENNKKRKITEPIRAINWFRFAEPFAVNQAVVAQSDELLHDSWYFNPDEFWDASVHNKEVFQAAPSIISRGMPLPEVTKLEEDAPFVVCCRYPNKVIAISTLGRTSSSKGYSSPKAEIRVFVEEHIGIFGIFGEYGKLILEFSNPLQIKTLLVQDLAGDHFYEITNGIEITDTQLILPGELLHTYGTLANEDNDLSEPGLVLNLLN